MATTDIEKAFLEAAEIAKKLPKNLQEIGFNKALEQLLAGSNAGRTTSPRPAKSRRDQGSTGTVEGRADIARLIDKIDRTSYPDVGSTARVADRALKVLQIANQDHEVDGLTATEIATVLSRKFRFPVKANSVLKALERESDTVDMRGKVGAARVFHIMAPGDAYLERLRSGQTDQPSQRSKVKRRPPRKVVATDTPDNRGRAKPLARKVADSKPSKKTSGRPGPKAAVAQLLQAGFFGSARTISQVQAELQHRRGHSYSVQELSPALVRSIREQSLSRGRNDAGQYEYSQP